MTAQQYLTATGKHPIEMTYGRYDYKFFWQPANDDTQMDDDDYHSVLPADLIRLMLGAETQSGCRVYDTPEDALADFEKAFAIWDGNQVKDQRDEGILYLSILIMVLCLSLLVASAQIDRLEKQLKDLTQQKETPK